jgi:FkbM family methyltransferase
MFFRFIKSRLRIWVGRQRKRKLLSCIEKLPLNSSVTLVDIGAAGEIQQRWNEINSVINYVGFEPDSRSRELLLVTPPSCKSYKIYPDVVSDVSEIVNLNLTKKPQVSSIYEPNMEILTMFPDSERFDVISKENIETTRLDDLDLKADFIKLDIQGAELKALKGAEKLLNETLGIEIEVEFVEIYKNQPKYAEINSWLEMQGFILLDFVNIYRWERENFNGLGQVIFVESLYIKTPETLVKENINVEKISSYFIILFLYKRYDLIYTYYKLLSDNLRNVFSDFVDECEMQERKQIKLCKFNSRINFIIKFIDPNYQSHLLY